jgi:hypothetical protein
MYIHPGKYGGVDGQQKNVKMMLLHGTFLKRKKKAVSLTLDFIDFWKISFLIQTKEHSINRK